jgi:hypothetical protein
VREIVERFRQKGATSPEKAMTIQELGLPTRFGEAMHRRLGQSGIFVEINGKYYLNEERLKQIREQRVKRGPGNSGGGWSRTSPPTWFRIVGILLMLPIGLIIAVLLYYVFGFRGGFFSGEFLLVFAGVFLVSFVARLLFRMERRKYWREHLGRSDQ